MSEEANVLIVDDLADNLAVLGQILKNAGYRVRATLNGELALNAAALEPPDVILLDVMMPVMDGYAVCEKLKANVVTAEIPVLFISALSEPADKVRAFHVGGVDFISKPFDQSEVLARVAAHTALARARRELNQKNTELEKALAELQNAQSQLVSHAKMASLGVLTAGIAHELNNPINFLYANTQSCLKLLPRLDAVYDRYDDLSAATTIAELAEIETLKRQMGHAENREVMKKLLEGIRIGAERCANIIRSLRLFSRDAGATVTSFDLNDNLDTALLMLSNRIGRSVRVDKDYRATPTMVGHPGALNQLFVNLFSNAVDAMIGHTNSPVLHVHTAESSFEDKPAVVIEVTDNGPGIADTDLPHIFDPFFTTKPVGAGTGLGLSIAFGIARDHGGKLEAENIPEGGARLRLLLPRH